MEILTAIQEQQIREAQTVVDNIVILQELKQFIPPLSPEESQRLESNILQEGIRDSLILWKTTSQNYFILSGLLPENYESKDYSGSKKDLEEFCYILIDGHNRYRIAQKHKIEFSFDIYEFESIGTAKQFMINLQLGRRNLTREQISYFRGLEYQNLKQQHGGTREKEATYQNDKLTTAQTLAQKHKVGEATILRDSEFSAALDIVENYNPRLKQLILQGDIKVKKETFRNLPKIKEYRILHADNFENEESLNDLLNKPLEIWENGEYKGEVKQGKKTTPQRPAPEQEIDFFDRVGEEREPSEPAQKPEIVKVDQRVIDEFYLKIAENYKEISQLNKEIGKLKFELNETQDQLYNIQKSFQTNSADERIKLTKKGFKLMRCNGEKINVFDAENYSWKLFEKFATKTAAQEKMKELKLDDNIIFE